MRRPLLALEVLTSQHVLLHLRPVATVHDNIAIFAGGDEENVSLTNALLPEADAGNCRLRLVQFLHWSQVSDSFRASLTHALGPLERWSQHTLVTPPRLLSPRRGCAQHRLHEPGDAVHHRSSSRVLLRVRTLRLAHVHRASIFGLERVVLSLRTARDFRHYLGHRGIEIIPLVDKGSVLGSRVLGQHEHLIQIHLRLVTVVVSFIAEQHHLRSSFCHLR
mmetsp:Transcript_42828/g.103207  ORF Transcript_42828/g.103207 Transcript_42828/m.103207 type:complete len:220 (-) Transcript_42828:1479-2138(-)